MYIPVFNYPLQSNKKDNQSVVFEIELNQDFQASNFLYLKNSKFWLFSNW